MKLAAGSAVPLDHAAIVGVRSGLHAVRDVEDVPAAVKDISTRHATEAGS